MSWTQRLSVVIALSWAAMPTSLASGQSNEDQPTNSGSRPFLVVRLSTNALDNSRKVMADFNSEKDAEEYATRLNAGTKTGDPFFYQVDRRKVDDDGQPEPVPEVIRRPRPSAPPRLTPIVKLPSVDPGPYRFREGYNDPFQEDGKKRIVGTWKGYSIQGGNKISVTVVFHEDGTVTNTASNGLSGRGTWRLTDGGVRVTWSTGFSFTWRLSGNRLSSSGTTSRGLPYSTAIEKTN